MKQLYVTKCITIYTLFAMLGIVNERLPSADVFQKKKIRNTIDQSINHLGPDQA